MSDLSPTASVATRPRDPSAALTRRQKAAVVVHLLIAGGVDPGLRDLPAAQQREIVREMARLRFVDRTALARVIAEFASELDNIGLHFPRDTGRVLATLDGRLSFDVIEALTAELGDDAFPGDGPWAEIGSLAPEEILALIDGESDEVTAILMSKLPPVRAAGLLAGMPSERAEAIAAAFARTEDVTPAAVARIGLALGRQAANRTSTAFETGSVRRVGNILNAATSGLRRGILESLQISDASFATRVRAAVFSFENIPDRIASRDVPRVLRGIDSSRLTVALKGVPPDMASVRDFILGSLSSRMGDQIRDGIEESPDVTPEDAETAMSEIVAAIRELEESGELVLIAPDA